MTFLRLISTDYQGFPLSTYVTNYVSQICCAERDTQACVYTVGQKSATYFYDNFGKYRPIVVVVSGMQVQLEIA